MRRLPGPAVADCAKERKLRRLSPNCFGTGREHQLNLLCGLYGVLARLQIDVRLCVQRMLACSVGEQGQSHRGKGQSPVAR